MDVYFDIGQWNRIWQCLNRFNKRGCVQATSLSTLSSGDVIYSPQIFYSLQCIYHIDNDYYSYMHALIQSYRLVHLSSTLLAFSPQNYKNKLVNTYLNTVIKVSSIKVIIVIFFVLLLNKIRPTFWYWYVGLLRKKV